jgi:uncharacterized protein
MSTQDNKQLLAEVFDALAVGDQRPFAAAMADDFRWCFAGDWSWALDWGSTKQQVRENLLQPLMAQFAEYRASADEIIAEGDRVIVRAHADATTVNGDPYPQAYCYVFRLHEGLITEVMEYCDTALVERVLTIPGKH